MTDENDTDDKDTDDSGLSKTRRNALRLSGVLSSTALAGCGLFGSESNSTPNGTGTQTPDQSAGPSQEREVPPTEEFEDYREPDREVWSEALGEAVVAAPVVTENSVLYGTDSGDVVALDAESGSRQWQYSTGSSALVYDITVVDSVAYVGVKDGVIEAFDLSNRTKRWEVSLGDGKYANSITVGDRTVYAGTVQLVQGEEKLLVEGSCLAVDTADGSRQWEEDVAGGVASMRPLVDGDTVYVGGTELVALDTATGDRQWTVDFGDDEVQGVAADVETLYTTTWAGVLAHAKADGARLWQYEDEVLTAGSPTVADGTLYTTTADRVFGALSTDSGEDKWTIELDRSNGTGVAVAEETVYVGAGDVWALNRADGGKQWRFKLTGNATGLALVDGTLYVSDGAGNATALDT